MFTIEKYEISLYYSGCPFINKMFSYLKENFVEDELVDCAYRRKHGAVNVQVIFDNGMLSRKHYSRIWEYSGENKNMIIDIDSGEIYHAFDEIKFKPSTMFECSVGKRKSKKAYYLILEFSERYFKVARFNDFNEMLGFKKDYFKNTKIVEEPFMFYNSIGELKVSKYHHWYDVIRP